MTWCDRNTLNLHSQGDATTAASDISTAAASGGVSIIGAAIDIAKAIEQGFADPLATAVGNAYAQVHKYMSTHTGITWV